MLRWRVLLVAAVLLVILAEPALAEGGTGGRVVFGQSFTLPRGERLDGNLVVFGGDVALEAGSVVRGDVMALGGSLRIDGRVDGDVFALGGSVELGSTAVVAGDVVGLGGVMRQAGATVGGSVVSGFERGLSLPFVGPERGRVRNWLPVPRGDRPWGLGLLGDVCWAGIRTFLGALAMVALGVLVVVLVPGLTRTASQAFVAYPVQSVGVGLLTLVAGVLAVILLTISCLGIPLAVLAAVALSVAAVFGWIVAGLALGDRLLAALGQRERPPVLAVTIGTAILSLLSGVMCLGFLLTMIVGAWGLGAAVLTRFGTTPYLATPPAVAPPAQPLPPATGEGDLA